MSGQTGSDLVILMKKVGHNLSLDNTETHMHTDE